MIEMNFDVISSTLISFSKQLVDLFMITSRARMEMMFCEYEKNIIICPSAQTDPSFSAI